jgi:outer membrane cobalamin receptor
VFEIARAAASLRGDDPDDIDFECRLPNAFLADPPLEQVVAESIEVGSRGSFKRFNYQLSFFRTNSKNDIIFQTTGRGRGLFSNVDNTRRQGIESSIAGKYQRLSWAASYSYIKATFEDDFIVLSPNHPLANSKGNISVVTRRYNPGNTRASIQIRVRNSDH